MVNETGRGDWSDGKRQRLGLMRKERTRTESRLINWIYCGTPIKEPLAQPPWISNS